MKRLVIPAPTTRRAPSRPTTTPPVPVRLERGLIVAVVLHLVAGWALTQFRWPSPGASLPVTTVVLPPVELLAPAPEAIVAGEGAATDTAPQLFAAPALPAVLPPALPGPPSAATMPVTAVITVDHILASSAPALWFRPPSTGPDESVAMDSVAGTVSGTGTDTNVVAVQAGYFRNPPPVYPPTAKAQGWEGTTILRVCVSTTGASSAVEVHQSSGYPVLDEAAVRAVRRWRFVPARENKVAVTAWVEVPVTFVLDRES